MKFFGLHSLVCGFLALSACSLSLDEPKALSPSADGGSPEPAIDGGAPADGGSAAACEGRRFHADHPWAVEAGESLIYVEAGASGSGASAEDPLGALPRQPEAMAAGQPITILLAPGRYAVGLDLQTADLSIIGACTSTVQVEATGTALVDLAGGRLRLSQMSLSGDAGQLGLVTLRGTASLEAQDLSLSSSELSHGLWLASSGSVDLAELQFGTMAGHGIRSLQASGDFDLRDSEFLGPIGHDGISIIDFGGSGFRVTNSRFVAVNGSALSGQGALGTWTVEDNTFLGPIGHDGISIIDFGGSGFRVAGNSFSEVAATGIFASEALGTWTVEDNTFLGPIGHDGIAVEGFLGSSMSIANNNLSQIGRVGIRLTGSQNISVTGNTIVSPGDRGIHAEGFMGEGDSLVIHDNSVSGALEAGLSLANMGIDVDLDGNSFTDTLMPEVGGSHAPVAIAAGILALDSGRLRLNDNTLRGNQSHALLMDLNFWGRDDDDDGEPDDPAFSGATALEISNTTRGEAEVIALQFAPDDLVPSGTEADDVSRLQPEAPTERRLIGRRGCGDGLLERGVEACDDGNRERGDGCDSECRRERRTVEIALGREALLIFDQTGLRGQGPSNHAELGVGPRPAGPQRAVPLPVGMGSNDVVNVSVGSMARHIILLARGGEVYTWGRNEEFQLGHENGTNACDGQRCSRRPDPLGQINQIRLTAAGYRHSCFYGRSDLAVAGGPRIICTGNVRAVLDGSQIEEPSATVQRVTVSDLPRRRWRQLEAGLDWTCALDEWGEVWCWGNAGPCLTGQGRCPAGPDWAKPASILAREIRHLSVGARHGCAIQRDGQLICWGANDQWQLGHNDAFAQGQPLRPGFLQPEDRFLDVSCGENFTCVIHAGPRRPAGSITCFGPGGEENHPILGGISEEHEDNIQMFSGPYLARPTFPGNPIFQRLVSAYRQTCAQSQDGNWFCWGLNTGGLLKPDQADDYWEGSPYLVAATP